MTATLTWRPLTTEDAPALARVYAAVEAVDRTGEHYSEQDLRDELQDESIDTVAAFAPDGELVAFARVRGTAAIYADGAVVPAARGRGLGRRLLAWAQQRGAGRVDVHENNPGKEALVRAAGYQPTRWEHKMTRTLDDALPAIPPPPPGLSLTPFAWDRDDAVRRAHCEAFAGHWGSVPPDERRWARSYTGMQAFRPDVSWLVMDGDEVAAYLLSYFWQADAVATGVREAFVGQLGVRPRWRRRGLGRMLLATALGSYRAAGYERAALTVDTGNATGALGLYERAGFAVTDTSTAWTKPLS